MVANTQNTRALMEKIQSLPVDRIAEVEDFVDFLKTKAEQRNQVVKEEKPLDFPVVSVGEWPKGLSLRREDMYGDDGR